MPIVRACFLMRLHEIKVPVGASLLRCQHCCWICHCTRQNNVCAIRDLAQSEGLLGFDSESTTTRPVSPTLSCSVCLAVEKTTSHRALPLLFPEDYIRSLNPSRATGSASLLLTFQMIVLFFQLHQSILATLFCPFNLIYVMFFTSGSFVVGREHIFYHKGHSTRGNDRDSQWTFDTSHHPETSSIFEYWNGSSKIVSKIFPTLPLSFLPCSQTLVGSLVPRKR